MTKQFTSRQRGQPQISSSGSNGLGARNKAASSEMVPHSSQRLFILKPSPSARRNERMLLPVHRLEIVAHELRKPARVLRGHLPLPPAPPRIQVARAALECLLPYPHEQF